MTTESPPPAPDDVAAHLLNYQQADAEGVMVLVSRQACDEAAVALGQQQRTLVEREAEVALWKQYHRNLVHSTNTIIDDQRAELAAARRVPREPTEAMILAASVRARPDRNTDDNFYGGIWRAMYDAAPTTAAMPAEPVRQGAMADHIAATENWPNPPTPPEYWKTGCARDQPPKEKK